MPRRDDIKKVLLLGSGPIVIGQAVEFDYSGTQALKALKSEGIEVVLLNSNPATVMTDPEFAARTYVEPLTVEVAEQIIAKERPDSLLPTMGGQVALNLAKALAERGILERYGVRMIGASLEAINKAEDRQLFKEAMVRIGMPMPRSGYARSVEEARSFAAELGFPLIIRPSFTLGGTGGGIARDAAGLDEICRAGLAASPTGTVLVEESVLGWKEYELEVVRDRNDNVIIVCSIENLDPMGVHTGDSITVAPAQTLTDKEYQRLRQASLAIVREIGVETGGCNIQFGVDPRDGRFVVIEMNPRVSRSSALASKATGYPIAKVAALLAVGYSLDELKNDITRHTPASFEPALDYVVTKIPRFNFEKFPGADDTLGTSMRAVGEVMSIGRTFQESFLKACRSLETGEAGMDRPALPETGWRDVLEARLRVPRPGRHLYLYEALRRGLSVEEVHALSKVDPWFLRQFQAQIALEAEVVEAGSLPRIPDALLRRAKGAGFSDRAIGKLLGTAEADVRRHRYVRKIRPVYKRVDTCAGEFEAFTPYFYSTYEEEDEAEPTAREKVLILGSGPIRIGQGVEFDYCCVHAAYALREAGFETVMVNCNPETVSTDYDTSDRLYLEPVTLEDVVEIARREKPLGAIVQFGGQTPLRLALALAEAGVPILGTPPDAIDRAEDRERFAKVVDALALTQPENGLARSAEEAVSVAEALSFPLMVRPSYVLGGRAMQVVYDRAQLERYMNDATRVSPEHPVLIDRFLADAIEVDLDLVADRSGDVLIGGLLEHIEEAGVHSGDAAAVIPPQSLSPDLVERMKDQASAIARELGVVGLMNVQFAIQGKKIFVLEVNPRASRTVPFVSKVTGVPLAKIASLCMVGKLLQEVAPAAMPDLTHVAVKESVFPFARFDNVDVVLGPEMRSTGEVMGLARDYPSAFAKSQLGAGTALPAHGNVFLSVRDEDKPGVVDLAKRLGVLGYNVVTTGGTHAYLRKKGVRTTFVLKISEGHPNVMEQLGSGSIALVINTSAPSAQALADSFSIRRTALMRGVPHFTTLQAARILVAALEQRARSGLTVAALQDYLR